MTLEEAIKHAEATAIENEKEAKRKREHGGWYYDSEARALAICAEENRQLAEWLRELQERRKEPEIVQCGECLHYRPMSSYWGKCCVHSSPTEKYRTCQICDYCSWAEKKEDKRQYIKNKLSTL